MKETKEMTLTVAQFLMLPKREHGKKTVYDHLIIVPDVQYEDTGFETMAVVGCDIDGFPIEIAAYFDDMRWIDLAKSSDIDPSLRCDMLHKSKCLRFWSRTYDFEVGYHCYNLEIRMVRKEIRQWQH